VADLGAEVALHGDDYDSAFEHAQALAAQRNLAFIHPFDDPDVIAGQGTIGVEMLRQCTRAPDAIFAAIGGGGLIAGVASYVKRISPRTRIVGVQTVDSDAMRRSVAAGRRIRLSQVGLFADGIAVRQVGRHTFPIVRDLVDEIVVVDTDAICAAIKDVFEDTRSILEPAGALAVAGAKRYVEQRGTRSQHLFAVACGANTNFDRLRFISERAEVGEHREALLGVTIPERPGSFRAFCALLGNRSITEFNYRLADPAAAQVFVGVKIRERGEIARIVAALRRAGLRTLDLSSNEMAKLHIRHLVGGRAPQARPERLYRFQFPERPGALMAFLDRMRGAWNISLFHYRNHGDDHGRVLVGMEVPDRDRAAFGRFLDGLGYSYVDESGNPAYRLFLG